MFSKVHSRTLKCFDHGGVLEGSGRVPSVGSKASTTRARKKRTASEPHQQPPNHKRFYCIPPPCQNTPKPSFVRDRKRKTVKKNKKKKYIGPLQPLPKKCRQHPSTMGTRKKKKELLLVTAVLLRTKHGIKILPPRSASALPRRQLRSPSSADTPYSPHPRPHSRAQPRPQSQPRPRPRTAS